MFDKLGSGWPKHSCFDKRYRELVARVVPILQDGAGTEAATFRPFAELRQLMGTLSHGERPGPSCHPLPPIPRPAKDAEEFSIKRMDPMPGEQHSMIGVLREISLDPVRLKVLFASLGELGRKAFGLPAKKDAVQITVVDVGGIPNESYTAVVDRGLLDRSLVPGLTVMIALVAKVSGDTRVWLVEEIQPL